MATTIQTIATTQEKDNSKRVFITRFPQLKLSLQLKSLPIQNAPTTYK